MRETLIVLACFIIGIALRSCRTLLLRKLGMLTFLATSFLIFFFIFDNVYIGLVGVLLWFFLPWLNLLTQIRQLRIPLKNRLSFSTPPSPEHFPNASRLIKEIELAEFDHITDNGWYWTGMQQYFRFFWNPETKSIASVCLCEQDQVAFAFVTVSSRTRDGRSIHTTNYPFSPTLKHAPKSSWAHLPCERNCFQSVSQDHHKHITRLNFTENDLMTPDPDEIIVQIETEMQAQIDHNIACGLIKMTDEEHFRYSVKGLFFLWFQSVKDMIRLC